MYGVRKCSNFIAFICSCPVFPAPFIEVSSVFCILASFDYSRGNGTYLFRVGCIKGSHPLSIAFGRDSGQAEREGSRYALIGLVAMGKLGEGHLCDWFGQHSCLFLIGAELEVGAKIETLAVIDSSLTIPRWLSG